MKRFAVLFAHIIAIILVTIISVGLTLFTFGVIQDCFDALFTSHFFPQVHETGAGRPDVPFYILLTAVGWSTVYRMCRYWIRMALGAPAPAEAEGKTGSDPPSPQEDKQLGWKHIAAFAALLATTIISVADTYLTIKSFHTLFTPFNILSTVVGWILAHRLWRYWKRMALRATGSEPAEPDGKDRLLKLVGKYYLKQGKNAEVVKLYEGADLSEAYPEDLVILALANIRLGNYETALKYYNDKRLASVSIKNLAADFPGIDTPNHLEASLLRIFAQ